MRMLPNSGHEGEEPSREDADFARQLGAVLRAGERPSAGFDERVMAAVREAHASPPAATILRRSRSISAWRRPRAVALPPMAWGALAAGFAAIVSVGTLALERASHPRDSRQQVASVAPVERHAVATPASHDTVYVVRFVLADARARTVSLVGDFNAWAKRATPLRVAKPGVWSAQVALPPGRHEYAFVVDGKRWVADPAAERLADDFDTPSSVVTVGQDGVVGR